MEIEKIVPSELWKKVVLLNNKSEKEKKEARLLCEIINQNDERDIIKREGREYRLYKWLARGSWVMVRVGSKMIKIKDTQYVLELKSKKIDVDNTKFRFKYLEAVDKKMTFIDYKGLPRDEDQQEFDKIFNEEQK